MPGHFSSLVFRWSFIVLLVLLILTPHSAPALDSLMMPDPGEGDFAEIPPLKVMDFTPQFKERLFHPTKAENYQQVMDFLGVTLSKAELEYLDKNRFLLLEVERTTVINDEWDVRHDEMLSVMELLAGNEAYPCERDFVCAPLITPDLMLHAFARYSRNLVEYLEMYELGPDLKGFVAAAQVRAKRYMKEATGPLKKRYQLIVAQLTVARVLIENAVWPANEPYGPPIPELKEEGTLDNGLALLRKYGADLPQNIFDLAEQELRLIHDNWAVTFSPLFSVYRPRKRCNYKQYIPQGHFKKNSCLSAYFRTMVFLSQQGYSLDTLQGLADSVLMAHILSGPGPGNKGALSEIWRTITDVTDFFVCPSDEVGFREWRKYLMQIMGTDWVDPNWAVDPAALQAISGNLKYLPSPMHFTVVVESPELVFEDIEEKQPKTYDFTVFGQRFQITSWTLSHLFSGRNHKETIRPEVPSALIVALVMGLEPARGMLADYSFKNDKQLQDKAILVEYLSTLDSYAKELDKAPDEAWFNSIGGVWFKLLSTLNPDFGEGYPVYMQSKPFATKSVQTFLGSFTDLRHSNPLDLEPEYGVCFEGCWRDGLVSKGFVEPNLKFWYRLQQAVDFMMAGFAKYNMYTDGRKDWGTLGRFKNQVDLCTRLAEKELRNEPITEEEHNQLRALEYDYMAGSVTGYLTNTEEGKRSARVTSINKDRERSEILYEATARPYVMLALVGNENSPRIVLGVAFNHYEFTGFLGGKHMDDREWQGKLYDSKNASIYYPIPDKNPWYDDLKAE